MKQNWRVLNGMNMVAQPFVDMRLDELYIIAVFTPYAIKKLIIQKEVQFSVNHLISLFWRIWSQKRIFWVHNVHNIIIDIQKRNTINIIKMCNLRTCWNCENLPSSMNTLKFIADACIYSTVYTDMYYMYLFLSEIRSFEIGESEPQHYSYHTAWSGVIWCCYQVWGARQSSVCEEKGKHIYTCNYIANYFLLLFIFWNPKKEFICMYILKFLCVSILNSAWISNCK